MSRGAYTVNSSSVSATGTQFDFASSATSSTSFSAIASAKNQFNVIKNLPSNTTFIASYDSNYDQPASLVALAGNYAGMNVTVVPNYNTFQRNIAISGSTLSVPADASGCSASGTVAPHNTSQGIVGVFDLSLRFDGASCAMGNGATAQGIIIQNDNGSQIQVMAVTPNEKGFFFLGNRQ
jgi:hypothetical protein